MQTEYAFRPYPRLTTTILNDGQVIHKIEKKLEKPIGSVQEQSEMEQMIKRQHSEVVSIINQNTGKGPQTLKGFKEATSGYYSLADRLKTIQGVQKVYELDNDGNFLSENRSEQFRQVYSTVYKGLRELINIFAMIPGIGMTRERGVYEVERDRLYLVSCGDEICIVTVKGAPGPAGPYEQAFKQALDDFFQES